MVWLFGFVRLIMLWWFCCAVCGFECVFGVLGFGFGCVAGSGLGFAFMIVWPSGASLGFG